jgi:hypothetical protein
VTGERTVHESCHGDAVADQLGTLELDPTDALAQCSGVAYVCESNGYSWDSTACTTWPEGAPYTHPHNPESEPPIVDQNDGCRIGTPARPATSALLFWLLLGLRSRRQGL